MNSLHNYYKKALVFVQLHSLVVLFVAQSGKVVRSKMAAPIVFIAKVMIPMHMRFIKIPVKTYKAAKIKYDNSAHCYHLHRLSGLQALCNYKVLAVSYCIIF